MTTALGTMGRVYHLTAPPRTLLHPALALTAARRRTTGYGAPSPRPEPLEAWSERPGVPQR